MRLSRLLAPCAALAGAILLTMPARAEGPTSDGYDKRDANQAYTAPLYQTTQPSYVPQSVALSGPREIRDYRDGESVPPGYRPVERTRTGLVVGGAVTFGTLYFLSALVAAGNSDATPAGQSNPAAALWVPGIGPFIQMARTESSTANVFLAVDGAAQCAGLAMLVVGLTVPRTVLVRNDLGEVKPSVRATPIVGQGTTGMGVVGTF